MDSQFNKFVPDIIFYDSITQHCLSFQFNWYVALFVLEGRRIQVLFLCFRQLYIFISLCKDSISRYYSKRSARQLIFYKNFYKSVSSIVFEHCVCLFSGTGVCVFTGRSLMNEIMYRWLE